MPLLTAEKLRPQLSKRLGTSGGSLKISAVKSGSVLRSGPVGAKLWGVLAPCLPALKQVFPPSSPQHVTRTYRLTEAPKGGCQ